MGSFLVKLYDKWFAMDNELNNIKKIVLEANNNDRLLETILDLNLDQSGIEVIVDAHNKKLIDLISKIKLSHNKLSKDKIYIFYEKIQPILYQLDTDLKNVMDCLRCLIHQFVEIIPPDIPLLPFIDFCAAKASRPKDAITIIMGDPRFWCEFISSVLIAGTRLNFYDYFKQALELQNHPVVEIRKRVIFSFGLIDYCNDYGAINQACDCIEKAIYTEKDHEILGMAVKSALNLNEKNKAIENKLSELIKNALSKGGNYVIQVFLRHLVITNTQCPKIFLDTLINKIKKIGKINENMIHDLELAIGVFLRKNEVESFIKLFETTIISGNLSNQIFENISHELGQYLKYPPLNGQNIFNKLSIPLVVE